MAAPVRMCAACRKRLPKWDLLRFVAKDGSLFFDVGYKLPGRGINICPKQKCIEIAVKKRLFSKNLRVEFRERIDVETVLDKVMSGIRDKIVSYVRIARKFGAVCYGRESCFSAYRRGELKLLILAEDLSQGSKNSELGRFDGVKKFFIFDKAFWGEVLNRRDTAFVGITDKGVADKLENLIHKWFSLYKGVVLDG